MRRPLAFLCLPLLLVTLTAAEAPEAVQRAFGNTILSTYPDGRIAKLWLDPSGSYTGMGRRKTMSSGRWSVKGDKLCLKQTHPFAPPFFKYCTPIPHSDQWTATAVTGETIQVRLVQGRGPTTD